MNEKESHAYLASLYILKNQVQENKKSFTKGTEVISKSAGSFQLVPTWTCTERWLREQPSVTLRSLSLGVWCGAGSVTPTLCTEAPGAGLK